MSRLAVIGLGKLGACTAAAFAARGHDVIGADVNEKSVQAINAGRAPVVEPGLEALIAEAGARLRATIRIGEAVADADATLVVVPTPSLPDGRFSLEHVLAAVREIGMALRGGTRQHVVAITSTVLPGSLEHGIKPVFERESGRKVGESLGLCYNPEFIALGSVIHDFLNPDLVLIGESDARAGELLAQIYRQTCVNEPHIARMSIPSAELTKVALNTFVTTKISFANMLAELCEDLPGADVDDVCGALGHDRRIGARYLQGGLGYGGPCFPRDNVALAALARALDRSAAIPTATDQVNQHVVERIVARVLDALPAGGRVAVIGLAYKPGTAIVERSHGMAIVARLAGEGIPVVSYDPIARPAAGCLLGDRVAWAESVARCLDSSDVAVLCARDESLAREAATVLAARQEPLCLVDCWRLLEGAGLPPAVRRIPLGVGAQRADRIARLRALWSEV